MQSIATHSGSFHADDVFAAGVLAAVLRAADPSQFVEVWRTRHPDVIAKCDYAVDVGGEYDPERGRYDHHQKGFAARRPNSIPYAAAGLVWKHHGVAYVLSVLPAVSAEEAERIVAIVDARLVQYLDALDCGHMSPAVLPASLPLLVSAFNPSWSDLEHLDADDVQQCYHVAFDSAMMVTTKILRAFVRDVAAEVAAAVEVHASEVLDNGRIVVLPKAGLPWHSTVCNEMPDVLFVVYPDSDSSQYQLRVVPTMPDSFAARRDLPEAWAGLRDSDLARVSGIADAVFCHNGRFIAGARSKEGALALARQALA